MVSRLMRKKVAEQLEVLAIIPARGGSKSIPRKNIKPLGGAPLISYSIAAGQQARTVTRLIVSTDDEEVARVAESYNAEVPFMRPPELSRDETTDLPVFQHALRWLEKFEGYQPDIVVQLRPTSPLRPPHCVDHAVWRLLENPTADSVRTIAPTSQNPYKMWRIATNNEAMQPLLTTGNLESYNEPRQNLPPTYWQTGHVDVARYDTIMRQHSMTGSYVYPLVLDQAYAIDIDTSLDWERAEWLLARNTLDIVRPANSAPHDCATNDADNRRAHDDDAAVEVDQVARPDAAIMWQSEEVRQRLAQVRLLVLDFDGVMTDNRVLVRQDGVEAVWCDRSDGLGLARLRERGLEAVVLSTETNPVVTARARKLGIDCVQGCDAKLDALQIMARERNLEAHEVAYIGNDLNDLDCFRWVGLPIAVADAAKEVLAAARLITGRKGGRGAVREVTDVLIAHASHARSLSVSANRAAIGSDREHELKDKENPVSKMGAALTLA